jgi:hypothetical protein
MEAMGLGADEEVVPTTDEGKQRYLTKQLQLGEQFLAKGTVSSLYFMICFLAMHS